MRFLSLLAVAFLGAVTQVNSQSPVVEAESCLVQLTPAGQGSWRHSFLYRARLEMTVESRVSKRWKLRQLPPPGISSV